MELGNKIFNLRKEAGFSQEQLAEKLNVTRQTISNWECGQTTPDIIQAKNIAQLFQVTLDELVGNDVKNIIIERISNTEKMTNGILKKLKGLAILIICCLIIFIIITIGLCVYNYKINKENYEKENSKNTSFVIPETETKIFFCYLNNNAYEYRVSYEENYKVWTWFKSSLVTEKPEDYENETLPFDELDQYKDARELIQKIKSFYKERGGTWEEWKEAEPTQVIKKEIKIINERKDS